MWHLICTKILTSHIENLIRSLSTSIFENLKHKTGIAQIYRKKRLSEWSCNKEVFEKVIPPNTDALKKSGFRENLVCTPKTTTNNILDKKQRKHRTMWSKSPCLDHVKTNIGKIFLSLLKKHFPKKTSYTRFSIKIM